MATDLTTALHDGATRLGVPLTDEQAVRMIEYLRLLREWNRVYNLTAVTKPAEQVTLHLLDSLSILEWVSGERIADIGTGAGLPGIPLAIADPDRHYTLVEATAKKTRFINHVVRTLSIENVEIVTSRAEDYRPQTGFDTVVARAVAALPKLLKLGGALVAPGGILLAMKGRDPVGELRDLGEAWHARAVHRLVVPGMNAERHLVVIGKN